VHVPTTAVYRLRSADSFESEAPELGFDYAVDRD
jgi:hypothetical protein